MTIRDRLKKWGERQRYSNVGAKSKEEYEIYLKSKAKARKTELVKRGKADARREVSGKKKGGLGKVADVLGDVGKRSQRATAYMVGESPRKKKRKSKRDLFDL